MGYPKNLKPRPRHKVGWVPRELNLVISRLMDAGKAFFCRIEDVMLVKMR